MITIITNILPIILGYIGKFMAIKSKAASDSQKRMIEILGAKAGARQQAVEQSNRESPWAAVNRRVIIFVILFLVAIYPIAGIFGIETVIPVVTEGFSFLGIFSTPEEVEYLTVKGLLKYEEIFGWATMIIEFYFGAQLAKAR